MALSQLTTTELFSAAMNEAKESFNDLQIALVNATGTEDLVEATIKRLEDYLKVIQNNDKKILEKFGISGDVESGKIKLQQNFRNFREKYNFNQWSGINLERNFLEAYRISVNEKYALMQKYIDTVLIPKMVKEISEEGKEVTAESAREVINSSLQHLYADIGPKGTRITSSTKAVVESNSHIKILATRMTKVQKRRILELAEKAKQEGWPIENIKESSGQQDNTAFVSFQSEWYDITLKGMTASEAKKLVEQGKIDINEINQKMIDLVTAPLGSGKDIAIKYINWMLKQNPMMFFVGSNINGITGILGELSAIIAIAELLPTVRPLNIIRWVAQHKISGKQLSIDIVLRGLANIQVKETSQSDFNIPRLNIDFAEGNAEDIFKRLSNSYGVDFQDLELLFESKAFNVPAKLSNNGKFKEVDINTTWDKKQPKDWDAFVEAYELLNELYKEVQVFLTAFAPDFLYMAGGNEFRSALATLDSSLDSQRLRQTGNNLYIVAGVPQFASTMLENIIEDIKALQTLQSKAAHFNISSSLGTVKLGEESVSYNYVAYKNMNLGKKEPTTISRKARLTSSYGFDR